MLFSILIFNFSIKIFDFLRVNIEVFYNINYETFFGMTRYVHNILNFAYLTQRLHTNALSGA
jgi:hypothetical protein